MDSLAYDCMSDEYEEKRQDAAEEIIQHKTEAAPETTVGGLERNGEDSSSPAPSPSPDIFSEQTMPVSDGIDRQSESESGVIKETVDSSSSSSDDFHGGSSGSSSGGPSSLYQPGFIAPTINYEKDRAEQKLVAVIGREFDQPTDIARSLQEVLGEFENADSAKFVPFMVKRKTLLRGSFNTRDLGNHDLICLCYNASEARILLTGQDGFYTTLLKQIEALLGPNKAAFLITNYTPPLSVLLDGEAESRSHDEDLQTSSSSVELISGQLKARLSHQEPLKIYLDGNQVLSWSDEPERCHVERLLQLADMEPNPQSIFAANSCSIV